MLRCWTGKEGKKKKTSSPSELHMTRIILIIVTSRIWSQKKRNGALGVSFVLVNGVRAN